MYKCSLTALAIIIFLTGCLDLTAPPRTEVPVLLCESESDDNNVLRDISYTSCQPRSTNRIFLEEGSEMIPFLVLACDDYGRCLLLREHLLDQRVMFNYNFSSAGVSSYYEGSVIDNFLGADYYYILSQSVRDLIVNADIEITTRETLGTGRLYTTHISRKIFLLSRYEVRGPRTRTSAPEGIPLDFFLDAPSRIAYRADGQVMVWWLRTPNTSATTLVNGVDIEGHVGPTGVSTIAGTTELGVRPAFRMPSDTPIVQGELDGMVVYFLAE